MNSSAPPFRSNFILVLAVLSAAGATSCGKGDGGGSPVEPNNRAPVAAVAIPSQTMIAGESATVNVSSYFNDPDGDALAYAAATSNAAVASVSVSGSTLTIAAVAPGTATVTVTARDPTVARNLSNRRRAALFKELSAACSGYIRGDLQIALTTLIDDLVDEGHVVPDEDDVDGQTLFVEYPTLYPSGDIAYVAPRVRIEAGARSALDPSLNCTITPYVADELPDWSFDVGDIRVIAAERTYWEKLLILHGVHCGYRDAERLPADKDRVSRHYYDVAMITATETGRSALSDIDLLDAVRNHNLIAFRQAWKRFEEAVPGSVRLVPQPELGRVIERDYSAMQGMILGDVPDFGWVMEQLQHAEAAINRT